MHPPSSSSSSTASLPASRIQALTTSTLPLILERQRSISLQLAPSPFTQSTILKNLALLTTAVRVLELEGRGVQVGAGRQTGKNDAGKLREGVEKLLRLMEDDDEGRAKVASIRESFQYVPLDLIPRQRARRMLTWLLSARPPKETPPSPPPQQATFALASPPSSPPPANSDTDDDDADPLSRPAAKSQSFAGSYRDDEDDVPYTDDATMMQQQREVMEGTFALALAFKSRLASANLLSILTVVNLPVNCVISSEQDSRLATLSSSIARQHNLSLQIGDELDQHHELLEETDRAIDSTHNRLTGARRRLDSFSAKAKENGASCFRWLVPCCALVRG